MALYRTLDRAALQRLYVDEGLSLKEVAERLGPPATKRVVQRALELHRIPLRPARPPARRQQLMSREDLERLYVDECRSLPEVAAHFGVNPATVIRRMRALGLERRKGSWTSPGERQPLTRALLHEMRVVQRKSAEAIAEELGYSRIQVSSALRRHNIGATWKVGGSPVAHLGAAELWWWHHDKALPLHEIAARLRTHPESVAARMRELDVPVRGKGGRPCRARRI